MGYKQQHIDIYIKKESSLKEVRLGDDKTLMTKRNKNHSGMSDMLLSHDIFCFINDHLQK